MWLLLRRPLLVLFVMGCTVSFLASRRLSVRLIADGGLSFAFIDYRFFRDVMGRPPGAAASALTVQRAIGWICVIGYFVGIPMRGELWPEILEWILL